MPHVLEVIDNHTVAVNLLAKGPVLDAGSRGLRLAKWFRDRGHTVIALDPGESEKADGIHCVPMALVHSKLAGANVSLVKTDDLEARYIEPTWGDVYGISIPILMHDFKIAKWDLIKLNIEGSEYDILGEIEGPIARQIVFSFHEHTGRARGREECDRIIAKLAKWYDVHNQVWEPRYGCRSNYWDILLTERGV